jgi:glycosyltransferase involved in cell wall biosynthesis
MLCSIVPIKRVYEVVLMLSELKNRGFDARLNIAGSPQGDYRYAAAIYNLVERLGLQGSITFDGYVTDTPRWLKNIDILISNSYWEGQTVALLEGMASGCFCLSHHWQGAEEMLPADHLYFTESELLGKIIEYARMKPEEQQRQGQYLREIACRKFDIEKTKVRIRQILDEVKASKEAFSSSRQRTPTTDPRQIS